MRLCARRLGRLRHLKCADRGAAAREGGAGEPATIMAIQRAFHEATAGPAAGRVRLVRRAGPRPPAGRGARSGRAWQSDGGDVPEDQAWARPNRSRRRSHSAVFRSSPDRSSDVVVSPAASTMRLNAARNSGRCRAIGPAAESGRPAIPLGDHRRWRHHREGARSGDRVSGTRRCPDLRDCRLP